MCRFLLALAALAGLAACAELGEPPPPGSVYVASNEFRVITLEQPGTFEVQARGASGGASFFCAAGDYAWTMLSARPADRVVVIRPVGPSLSNPGGRSTIFALMPRGTAPDRAGGFSGLSANVRRQGENFTVGHAQAFCDRSMPGIFGMGRL